MVVRKEEGAAIAAPAAQQVGRVAAASGVVVALALLGAGVAMPTTDATLKLAVAAGLIGLVLLAATAWLLHRLAWPLDQLARDLAIIARDNPHHAFRLPRRHAAGQLATAAAALRDRLAAADERAGTALAEATAELDRRQRQLEAILLDLAEVWWSATSATASCSTTRPPPTRSIRRSRSGSAARCSPA
jgi:hypothetical protein